ncbi:MAG TPA: hypothetical protein VMC85_04150, partial [Desulfomonilaceae bacterium]|nr:hypothetical protein [Desulfomonilaceae bacterium]
QKLTGEAQIIFILLLSLARQKHDVALPNVARTAAVDLDNAMATALVSLGTHVDNGSQPAITNLEPMMDALERYVAASTNAPRETAATPDLTERLILYRTLVAAIMRLSSEPLNAWNGGNDIRGLAVQQ